MATNTKHTLSQNLKKSKSQNNKKGNRKETTAKMLHTMDLQNKKTEENDIRADPALAALKEDDEKWLTHFLMSELDDMFNNVPKEMERQQPGRKKKLFEKEPPERKRGVKIPFENKKMVRKQLERNRVGKRQVANKNVAIRRVENQHIKIIQPVRRRDLYWYPLPAAVGSPEYDIRIEEVLDTIKKHVKTDDIVEEPEDKDSELPVITFSIFQYFWSIGKDNKMVVDTENLPIL
ncbi:hypothetical protein RR46_00445 [Papilio xuthus]|uniref:Uncharacterized protein n=1 Tax=Papilio xuthus TaxID=66420 RepID=A0A0N0P9U2_PAPXU|nr:hypothetical protein RR46_00445 [Papilio xuthus]